MMIEQCLWDEMEYSNHLTGGFIPSGKRLHNYGKIHHCLMGKSTISMAIFNRYVKLPEGIVSCFPFNQLNTLPGWYKE